MKESSFSEVNDARSVSPGAIHKSKNGHTQHQKNQDLCHFVSITKKSDTFSNKLDSDIENLQLIDKNLKIIEDRTNNSSENENELAYVTIEKGICSEIFTITDTNNSTNQVNLKNPTNHCLPSAVTSTACEVKSSAIVSYTSPRVASFKYCDISKIHHNTISNSKFLLKTQSLDIAEERCNNLNEVDYVHGSYNVSDEQIIDNSQLPLKKVPTGAITKTTIPAIKAMMPKVSSLDNNHPPLFAQSRPIYANLPYSPYNSPFGSPRTGRRRVPLRESRRVSIDKTGSFLQLNQYKLMDQIGQVSRSCILFYLTTFREPMFSFSRQESEFFNK